jgi:hypothetical protein
VGCRAPGALLRGYSSVNPIFRGELCGSEFELEKEASFSRATFLDALFSPAPRTFELLSVTDDHHAIHPVELQIMRCVWQPFPVSAVGMQNALLKSDGFGGKGAIMAILYSVKVGGPYNSWYRQLLNIRVWCKVVAGAKV